MNNPKWHSDEILLALQLYFSPNRGSIDKKNPQIIALSKLLISLPLITNRIDEEKFRNPNSVTLKLSNFLFIDERYPGKGMKGASKLDEILFNKFFHKQEELGDIVKKIKAVISDEGIKEEIFHIEDDEQTFEDKVEEGTILYKLHKVRERSPKIIKQKKQDVLKRNGKLLCEVCGFDFYDSYGEIGKGFIECHHKTPLANIIASTQTSLKDLALVCSNCHRMLHKNINVMSVEGLREQLKPGMRPM